MSPDGGTARAGATALDDHTLWAAAGDGDRDAFATLYRRHADAVRRHAYRLTGSRTAAEDVVAETFATAWRRRSEVRFPPLDPEVRERILLNVLVRMNAPAPPRSRQSMPLLTAAAVLLVAIAVTTATTLAGISSDPQPAAGGTTTEHVLDPLPADPLPPPTGDPEIDAALARCATAVVRSGRAADYPPTTTWRGARIAPVGPRFASERLPAKLDPSWTGWSCARWRPAEPAMTRSSPMPWSPPAPQVPPSGRCSTPLAEFAGARIPG